jgi:hypothetical protein
VQRERRIGESPSYFVHFCYTASRFKSTKNIQGSMVALYIAIVNNILQIQMLFFAIEEHNQTTNPYLMVQT